MMHANKNSVLVNNVVGDIDVDLYPFLLGYKDGRIQRLLSSRFVPASENPAANRGVATRDVVIDHGTGVSARLFLPTRAAAMAAGRKQKLPIVVYIHGGAFCTESAFCRTYHSYATSLAESAAALVVSVEYRLAPEHPIPAAYDDASAALRWVASLSDPWLADHADPRRTFLAGDSAGGNIAYHTAVRAGRDGGGAAGMDIEGMVMVQPYFWGAERLPSEKVWDGAAVFSSYSVDWLWPFVTAGQAGNDDPRLNPSDEEVASLACRRVLVAVAEKDTLRERGVRLFACIRDCYARAGGAGEVTLVESEGEDHGFHLYSPLRATSRKLMKSIVNFINQPPPEMNDGGVRFHAREAAGKINNNNNNKKASTKMTPEFVMLGVPSRPFRDIFGYGMDMKHDGCNSMTTTCMAYGAAKIGGRGKAAVAGAFKKANYGLFMGSVRPNKAYMGPSAASSTPLIKNFF